MHVKWQKGTDSEQPINLLLQDGYYKLDNKQPSYADSEQPINLFQDGY